MAKNAISDYSATAASNTDVGGINIDEGMSPSGVNNAIRELMSHLADLNAGSSSLGTVKVDNLQLDGNAITSTDTNGNITLTPNGTGNVVIDGINYPQADGTANYFLKTDGAGQLSFAQVDTASIAADAIDGTKIADDAVASEHIADDAVGAAALNVSGNGTSGQMLTSDGDGSMSWVDQPSAGLTAVTLSGTTPTIDWSAGNLFTHTLTGDTTYTFSNVSGAKEIELFLKNVGNYYDPDAITSTPSNSFQFTTNTNALYGSSVLYWANNGSKLYLSVYQYSTTGYSHVLEYDASTAYDITTLTLNDSKTATQYYSMPSNGQVSNDGNYWFGGSGSTIKRFDFGTAYDVTTLNTNVAATADQQLDIGTSTYTNWTADFNNDSVRMIRFNEDGTKMCVVCASHKASLGSANSPINPDTALGVQTFSLSTGFDLTSTITKIGSGDLADAYLSIPDSIVKIATMNNEGTMLTVHLDQHNAGAAVANTYRIAVFVMKPFDPSTLQFFKDYVIEEQGHDSYTGTLALATNGDGSKLFMGETNSANDTSEKTIFEFPFATDYTITLPNNLTPLLVAGSSTSPSATSYLRIVTPDSGTNYYITSEQELL